MASCMTWLRGMNAGFAAFCSHPTKVRFYKLHSFYKLQGTFHSAPSNQTYCLPHNLCTHTDGMEPRSIRRYTFSSNCAQLVQRGAW